VYETLSRGTCLAVPMHRTGARHRTVRPGKVTFTRLFIGTGTRLPRVLAGVGSGGDEPSRMSSGAADSRFPATLVLTGQEVP